MNRFGALAGAKSDFAVAATAKRMGALKTFGFDNQNKVFAKFVQNCLNDFALAGAKSDFVLLQQQNAWAH